MDDAKTLTRLPKKIKRKIDRMFDEASEHGAEGEPEELASEIYHYCNEKILS